MGAPSDPPGCIGAQHDPHESESSSNKKCWYPDSRIAAGFHLHWLRRRRKSRQFEAMRPTTRWHLQR